MIRAHPSSREAQERLRAILAAVLEERQTEFRQVTFHLPPGHRPLLDVELGGMETEWHVAGVLGHEWDDMTGQYVFHLSWKKRSGQTSTSWERNPSVM